MKNVFLLLLLLISSTLFGQISTDPELANVSESFTLIFDATGTPLEDYQGELYAHTGVTLDETTNWQYVIESWGNNTTQPKFNKIDENLYSISIDPNIYEFYDVPSTENITGIDIVIRNDNATTQTTDLHINVYEQGFVIDLQSPTEGASYPVNQTFTIRGISNKTADLRLYINDVLSKQVEGQEIELNTSLSSTGHNTIKLEGVEGDETLSQEIQIYISPETVISPLPSGMNDGINITGNQVTFVLNAPTKTSVYLFGDFNDWTYETAYLMNRDGDRFWITLNDLDPDMEYAYQYNIDGSIQIADPHAYKVLDPENDKYISETTYPNLKAYPENAKGIVSVFQINKPTFSWDDSEFIRPSLENGIIYELLIRDFTEAGTYQAVIDKLDYLEDLGVTAIELLPVNEFEGNVSWGYNPSFFKALDKAYGTENDFKNLVNQAHQRGISIILDVVLNHSFGQSPLLAMYWDDSANRPAADNPWYNQESNFENTALQWGQDFDHESEHTTTFFKDVLSYWVEEFHIDGYRFDFTKGLSNTYHSLADDQWGSNYDAARISILKDYADYLWNSHGDDLGIIFEHLADNSEETELADYGIYLWANANHNWNQNTMGYSEDSSISWTDYKSKGWNTPNALNYMESHDEERLMYKTLQFGNSEGAYDVRELSKATQRHEAAHLIAQALRGPKMIWQFGELGYDISIDEGGRTSPKPVLWEYEQDPYRKHLYSTIATINKFKTTYADFNSENYEFNETGLQKSLIIQGQEFNIVILANFGMGTSTSQIAFPGSETYYDYFEGKHVQGGNQSISLKPGGYKLYTTQVLQDPLNDGSGDSDGDGVVDDLDQCPNTLIGTPVDGNGCPIVVLDPDNFTIETYGLTCPNEDNGQLLITTKTLNNYVAEINGMTYEFESDLELLNLAPGDYTITFTLDGDQNYEAVFTANIPDAEEISLDSSTQVFGDHTMSTINMQSGTAPYDIYINGRFVFDTYQEQIQVKASHGDKITVESAKPCEGEQEIFMPINPVSIYPNPVINFTKIALYHPDIQEVRAEIFNQLGQRVSSFLLSQEKPKELDFSSLAPGVYYVRFNDKRLKTQRFIKK